MKIIADYLKHDLGMPQLETWGEIRAAYLERAANMVKHDFKSPSYLYSMESQAGRQKEK